MSPSIISNNQYFQEIRTPEMNNNLRRFARSAKPWNNQRHTKIKIGVIQLLNSNPFIGIDREDRINHLVKFYKIFQSPWALEGVEGNLYLRLFPHSLIECAKDRYLDQQTTSLTSWNTLEDKFIKRLFPRSRIHDANTPIIVFT